MSCYLELFKEAWRNGPLLTVRVMMAEVSLNNCMYFCKIVCVCVCVLKLYSKVREE